MGLTILEKILARASGRKSVKCNDVVVARPDLLMFNDCSAKYVDWLEKHDIRLSDPNGVVFCFDHFFRSEAPAAQSRIRIFARREGIPDENVYDIGRHGLQHQVPAEEGWVVPGMLFVGADTQSATMGALGCAAFNGAGNPQHRRHRCNVDSRATAPSRSFCTGNAPGSLGQGHLHAHDAEIRQVAASHVMEFAGGGVVPSASTTGWRRSTAPPYGLRDDGVPRGSTRWSGVPVARDCRSMPLRATGTLNMRKRSSTISRV